MNGASGNKPNYQLKHKLVGHDLGAVSVKFSPGGAWLASASADSTIKIWDPQSGKLIRTLTGHDKVDHFACLHSNAACQGTHHQKERLSDLVFAALTMHALMRCVQCIACHTLELFAVIRLRVCVHSTHMSSTPCMHCSTLCTSHISNADTTVLHAL